MILLLYPTFIICRKDIAPECIHKRFLYSSLVRRTWQLHLHFAYDSCSEPTVFENYVHDIYVEEQPVELSLWDTAGALLHHPIYLARERCNI